MFAVERIVVPALVNSNSYAGKFVQELEEAVSLRVKMYVMEVEDEERTFTFVTTSKDTFLGLGAMTTEGQYFFAKMLEEEFKNGACDHLLVFLSENGDSVLVTKTASEDLTRFTLSPAR